MEGSKLVEEKEEIYFQNDEMKEPIEEDEPKRNVQVSNEEELRLAVSDPSVSEINLNGSILLTSRLDISRYITFQGSEDRIILSNSAYIHVLARGIFANKNI